MAFGPPFLLQAGLAKSMPVATEPILPDIVHQFDQVVELGRLCQKGICAQIIGLNDLVGQKRTTQYDNDDASKDRLLSYPRNRFEAIRPWHFEVKENQKRNGMGLAIRVNTLPGKILNQPLTVANPVRWICDSGFSHGLAKEHNIVIVIITNKNNARIDGIHLLPLAVNCVVHDRANAKQHLAYPILMVF